MPESKPLNQGEIRPEINQSQKHSQTQVEREIGFDNLVSEISKSIIEKVKVENEIIEELNKKHAVIHTDQFYILTEKTHVIFGGKDFTLESKQSFINTCENQIPPGYTLNKAKIWLKHPDRRQFYGINFDLTTTEHKNGLYNIWNGFSVNPSEGKCCLFKNHIYSVICSGN